MSTPKPKLQDAGERLYDIIRTFPLDDIFQEGTLDFTFKDIKPHVKESLTRLAVKIWSDVDALMR